MFRLLQKGLSLMTVALTEIDVALAGLGKRILNSRDLVIENTGHYDPGGRSRQAFSILPLRCYNRPVPEALIHHLAKTLQKRGCISGTQNQPDYATGILVTVCARATLHFLSSPKTE